MKNRGNKLENKKNLLFTNFDFVTDFDFFRKLNFTAKSVLDTKLNFATTLDFLENFGLFSKHCVVVDYVAAKMVFDTKFKISTNVDIATKLDFVANVDFSVKLFLFFFLICYFLIRKCTGNFKEVIIYKMKFYLRFVPPLDRKTQAEPEA